MPKLEGIYVTWVPGPGEKHQEGIPRAGQLSRGSQVTFAGRCDSWGISLNPSNEGLKYRLQQRWAIGQWGTGEHWSNVTSFRTFKEACDFAIKAVRRSQGDLP